MGNNTGSFPFNQGRFNSGSYLVQRFSQPQIDFGFNAIVPLPFSGNNPIGKVAREVQVANITCGVSVALPVGTVSGNIQSLYHEYTFNIIFNNDVVSYTVAFVQNAATFNTRLLLAEQGSVIKQLKVNVVRDFMAVGFEANSKTDAFCVIELFTLSK